MGMKPSKKVALRPAVAPEPLRLRRAAMNTAVDEMHYALGQWLCNDIGSDLSSGETEHDYERGEYLARQLHQLVEMLISEVKDVEYAAKVCSGRAG